MLLIYQQANPLIVRANLLKHTDARQLLNNLGALADDVVMPGNNLQVTITCEEAAKNAPKVKAGMKEAEVIELIGQPGAREGNKWSYSFWACARMPRVGETKIIGMALFFDESVVKDIKYAIVDATGPAPTPAKKKSKKKS